MESHFKVVLIKELGEVEPVPHLWESKEVLYWPPSKNLVRLNQSNINSVPDKKTWTKYSCVVKAQGILLFTHASSTADRLCENSSAESSTDEENRPLKHILKSPARHTKFKNVKSSDKIYEFHLSKGSICSGNRSQIIENELEPLPATESLYNNNSLYDLAETSPAELVEDKTLTDSTEVHLVSNIQFKEQFNNLISLLHECKCF